jgi:hypothetical protein
VASLIGSAAGSYHFGGMPPDRCPRCGYREIELRLAVRETDVSSRRCGLAEAGINSHAFQIAFTLMHKTGDEVKSSCAPRRTTHSATLR